MGDNIFMTPESISILFYESMRVTLVLLLPLLLSILFIGLIVSIFQSVTQINEQTLSFIPKIITLFLSSFFLGPWMLHVILDYMQDLFKNIPFLIFCIC